MLEGLVSPSEENPRVTTPPPSTLRPQAPPPTQRRSWSLRPGPIVLAAACFVGVWLTQRIFVQWGEGFWRDEQWRIDIQSAAGRVWDARAHDLGVASLQIGLLLCAVLALVALARRRVDLFVRGAVLVAGANATTQLLKRVVIERPDYVTYGSNSLPSGHVTLVASVVLAALVVLPVAVRPLVVLVGGGWVALVAVSTVVSGWHRPSDTVAALLVCAGWAALVAAVRPSHRYALGWATARR
jgi:membrane-associated phospholipid phosphatase